MSDLDGLEEYRCSAGENCMHGGTLRDYRGDGAYGRYDRYHIYAGKWHDDCWAKFGYADFVFDPLDAGESLEPDF